MYILDFWGPEHMHKTSYCKLSLLVLTSLHGDMASLNFDLVVCQFKSLGTLDTEGSFVVTAAYFV